MIKSNYIVHDCETGGLNEQENPITQYAAVILDYKTLKEVDRFETFVKPYNNLTIDEVALSKTMVTMSDVNSGMDIDTFVKTLSKFLRQHKANNLDQGRLVSVGHNVQFDHRFLDYAMSLKKDTIWNYIQESFIDTMPLSKLIWGLTGKEKINLGATCERAGIVLTDAHGAMNDVEATADLLRFYMKRLRKSGGTTSEASVPQGRARGKDFFEFRCGAGKK